MHVRILSDGPNRNSVQRGDAFKNTRAVTLPTKRTAWCADPQRTFPIFEDRVGKAVIESLQQCVALEASVLPAYDTAAIGACPQTSIPGHQKAPNIALFKRRGVSVIKHFEGLAIEAGEAP